MREDVFISYSTHTAWEQSLAETLHEALVARGVTVWRDAKNLYGGAFFVEEIVEGLQRSKCVISLLTPEAVTREYLLAELFVARMFGKSIPIAIDPLAFNKIPFGLGSTIHAVRYSHGDGFEEIFDAIAKVSQHADTDSILNSPPKGGVIQTLTAITQPLSNPVTYQSHLRVSENELIQANSPTINKGLALYNEPRTVVQGLYALHTALKDVDQPKYWQALAVLSKPFVPHFEIISLAKAGLPLPPELDEYREALEARRFTRQKAPTKSSGEEQTAAVPDSVIQWSVSKPSTQTSAPFDWFGWLFFKYDQGWFATAYAAFGMLLTIAYYVSL